MTWPGLGAVSANLPEAYAQLGAAAVGQLLDAEQLEAVRTSVAHMLPNHGVHGGYASIIHDSWRKSDVLASLVPRLGGAACAAIGVPELVLFHDHILVKPPGGDHMEWHQDFSYLPIDRAGGVTLWIALDDVTEANGCIYYLFGSHLHGEYRAAWGMMGADDPRAQLPPIKIESGQSGVAAPTAAGWAAVHHTHLLHRSPRNESAAPRRSWALSFVVPQARWSPSHAPHPRSAVSPRQQGDALEADLLRGYAPTSS